MTFKVLSNLFTMNNFRDPPVEQAGDRMYNVQARGACFNPSYNCTGTQ